jgi:putative peptide zinc metalloprotease protein
MQNAAASQIGSSSGELTPQSTVEAIPERPALAPGVMLVGEMPETGFENRQWLVMRGTQFLQVTELLYRLAEQINGERTVDEIAQSMTDATEWIVTPDNVRHLLQAKLIPLGLIDNGAAVEETGRPQAQDRAATPLGVNMRMAMIGPNIIDPVTRVLQYLYTPPMLTLMLVAVIVAHGWLYTMHLAPVVEGLFTVLYDPNLLLVSLLLMLFAAIFHEFGHAAALRYGGGKVRTMGAGLYLMFPVFYTDVTDSYRLGRGARVRTDVGGFYFYSIFALGLIGLYLATGESFLLFPVVLISLDILRQLFIPFVRSDGYWLLADLTGIPDFFSLMVPFIRSILPGRRLKGDKLPPLKPWVRTVFITYIVLTLPVIGFLLFVMIRSLPVIIGGTWDAFSSLIGNFTRAVGIGDVPAILLLLLQMVVLLLPVMGIILVLYATLKAMAGALWRWSSTTSLRRLAGGLIAAAFIAWIAWLWTPQLVALADSGPPGTQSFRVTRSSHVEAAVSYPQTPPVGGDHAPIWQNCGFYDAPIASENSVHSMEHGAVWLTYSSDLPEEQISILRGLAQGRSYVLVSPFPDLDSPIVASAWGRQLRLTSTNDPRLLRFIDLFRLSPKAPERGEPCTNGTGTPK